MRVRLNPVDAVTALLTFEMELAKLLSVLNSASWADPWLLAGHASVVFAVGVSVVAPLAGVSTRLPGSDPTPEASANPAVTSPTPAIMPTAPESTTPRRILVAVRHLNFSSRKRLSVSLGAGIADHATACTANSGCPCGENLENEREGMKPNLQAWPSQKVSDWLRVAGGKARSSLILAS
jgi:hypothetical protein